MIEKQIDFETEEEMEEETLKWLDKMELAKNRVDIKHELRRRGILFDNNDDIFKLKQLLS